ncbi:NUDIX hydrolase [Halomontanus rarus]|uniref:NUDIX hydrolase n=1 Tax=Halomontanus rarus TaxID=3034020 RepID=UPI0023E7D6B5|nr:NUDIX domain-containing protein [Halovivax sp. TS33]
MSTTHINREAVERRLSRLRSAYGDVSVLEREETNSTERFDELQSRGEDGYTGGGYAWIVRDPEDAPELSGSIPTDAREERSHVLLIVDRGDESGNRWSLPGGGREGDETYERATVREVREETGLEIGLESPFLIYRVRHVPEDGRDRCLHTLWVSFDATYEGGSVQLQTGELRGAAWFPTPPPTLGPWALYRAVDWWDVDPDDPWWNAAEIREP